jgi:hypothetical protein
MRFITVVSMLALLGLASGCHSDRVEADLVGVGAQCATSADCPEVDFEGDAGVMRLQCLTTFNGGYCGLADCSSNAECPGGSVCIAHDDPAGSFCFRSCTNKPECNANRDVNHEANCNGGADPQDPADEASIGKVCYPSSSGT